MANYSTKQHSSLLKILGQKMDEIEKDKTKELIFNILLPVRKMNDDIYHLTSEYAEFTENKESLTFLNQLNIFNNNIMKILNDKPIEYPSNETSNASSSDKTPNGHPNNKKASDGDSNNNTSTTNTNTNTDEMMPLYQLIEVLVATDIAPINYDKDLLINCLIQRDINNENVVNKKNDMIAILEDCRFPPNRAQFTFEQIERNLSASKQQQHIEDASNNANSNGNYNGNYNGDYGAANTYNNNNNDRTNAVNGVGGGAVTDDVPNDGYGDDETEDAHGIKVIDLTVMAIEGVFRGQIYINRASIGEVYKRNEIDTAKLSCMTEKEFSDILTQCEHGSNFSKSQCIKIHRAIKSLLNISIKFRFNIDIGLAIIYLINEDNTFTQRDITVKPEKILAAFKNHNAKEVLKMGKKTFIKILQTQTHIKMGHATKLWNSIKAFIEDSNLEIPPQILIKEEADKE